MNFDVEKRVTLFEEQALHIYNLTKISQKKYFLKNIDEFIFVEIKTQIS